MWNLIVVPPRPKQDFPGEGARCEGVRPWNIRGQFQAGSVSIDLPRTRVTDDVVYPAREYEFGITTRTAVCNRDQVMLCACAALSHSSSLISISGLQGPERGYRGQLSEAQQHVRVELAAIPNSFV